MSPKGGEEDGEVEQHPPCRMRSGGRCPPSPPPPVPCSPKVGTKEKVHGGSRRAGAAAHGGVKWWEYAFIPLQEGSGTHSEGGARPGAVWKGHSDAIKMALCRDSRVPTEPCSLLQCCSGT